VDTLDLGDGTASDISGTLNLYEVVTGAFSGASRSQMLPGLIESFNTGGGLTIALNGSTGAITSTSVVAAGIVDGEAPVTIETAAFSFGITYSTGYYIVNNGSTATTGTLPTAAAGKQYCVRNIAAATSALTIQTSASGQYIDNAGGYTASGGYVVSGGALGDAACIVAIDTTHWLLYISSGTWTTH
jgi:hypothetical protein